MKPECAHIRERLSECLDGRLTPADQAEVDAHLAGCPECRKELELLRAMIEAVAELPRHSAPAGFGARVLERLGAAERPAPARPRLLSLYLRALPVAAMFLLVFGVIFIVQRSGTLGGGGRPVPLARHLEAPRGGVAPAARVPAAPAAAAAPAAPAAVGGVERAALSSYASRGTGLATQPAEAEEKMRDALEAADRGSIATRAAGGPARRTAVGAELREAAVNATGAAGGEVVFQQALAARQAIQRPQQVLTLYASDPADLMRRATEVANRQGLEVTLVFKPGGQADISVQVPTDRYEALVTALADLTAPESQSLSNSALARGDFFRKVLDDYNASNQLRQKQQQAGNAPMLAAMGQPEEQPRTAMRSLAGSAPAAAPAAEARAGGGAAGMAGEQAEAVADMVAAAPEKELNEGAARAEALAYSNHGAPAVVNLQISIQRLPAPPAGLQ